MVHPQKVYQNASSVVLTVSELWAKSFDSQLIKSLLCLSFFISLSLFVCVSAGALCWHYLVQSPYCNSGTSPGEKSLSMDDWMMGGRPHLLLQLRFISNALCHSLLSLLRKSWHQPPLNIHAWFQGITELIILPFPFPFFYTKIIY